MPKLDEEKDQPSKLKVPKVKAENQLLFLDDLIYELPTGEQFISKRNQKSKLEKIIFEEDHKNGAQGNNIDVQKEESEDEDFKRFEDEQFDDPAYRSGGNRNFPDPETALYSGNPRRV